MFSRVFQNESDIDELRLVYILFRNIRRDFRAGGIFFTFFYQSYLPFLSATLADNA